MPSVRSWSRPSRQQELDALSGRGFDSCAALPLRRGAGQGSRLRLPDRCRKSDATQKEATVLDVKGMGDHKTRYGVAGVGVDHVVECLSIALRISGSLMLL